MAPSDAIPLVISCQFRPRAVRRQARAEPVAWVALCGIQGRGWGGSVGDGCVAHSPARRRISVTSVGASR
jgi:hypothetical protein